MRVDIFNTENRYEIIYADPPWRYNARNNPNTKFGGGVHAHYPTMSFEEIKELPIEKITAEDCALFLWTTFPYIDKQLEVFSAWGFEYKTLGFSWIKLNKRNQQPFFGTGYYTKSNCECCLLGIKGKMKPISNYVSSCLILPRREHSRKPDEVRTAIVRLFGDRPRIELFAREQTVGWDCWGNEV